MRSALLLAACACSRPQPPPIPANRPASTDVCDVAAWRAQAGSSMRARFDDRDLVVVDSCYGVSRVIAQLPGAIVASTLSDRALTRVVTRETPLWEAPGGPPLPGIFVEPGVPVTGDGDWRRIEPAMPIEAYGYVPARATGTLWTAHALPVGNGQKIGHYVEVVAEPTAGATHLADVQGFDPVFDRIEAGPGGWRHVTAHDTSIRVTGWVAPAAPPPPSRQRSIYDFSDDVIEGDLVHPEGEDGNAMGPESPPRPLAAGCIRARPDDASPVIGVVDGELAGTREGDGWVRVELWTPWGRVVGHAHEAPPPYAIPE
jgi:hypothetical protein